MRNFTEEEQELILKTYVEEKRGMLYTSKLVHSSPETVKKFLKQKNIHIRTFSEAASESNKNRAKNKNKNYFDTESENMAWVLGFIAADGTIRKDKNEIKITLAIKDKEILERIKAELDIENEVKEYTTNQGYDCCTLTWSCQEHKQKLAEYSIVPNKTFILEPPYKLDSKYYIDYIRGYFDGDGSISLIANTNSLRWQICGAKKEFLQWIADILFEQYNIPKVNIQTQNRDGHILYTIQYSTSSTKKIYDVLYGTNSNMYLKRKKDHYESLLFGN